LSCAAHDRKANESLILRLKTYARKLGWVEQGSPACAGGWGTRFCWARRSTTQAMAWSARQSVR